MYFLFNPSIKVDLVLELMGTKLLLEPLSMLLRDWWFLWYFFSVWWEAWRCWTTSRMGMFQSVWSMLRSCPSFIILLKLKGVPRASCSL